MSNRSVIKYVNPVSEEQTPRTQLVPQHQLHDEERVAYLKEQFLYHISGKAAEDNLRNGRGAFTVGAAARAIGVPSSVIKEWRAQDKVFDSKTEEAIADAVDMVINREWIRALIGGGPAIERVLAYRQTNSVNNVKTFKVIRDPDSGGTL